jgi:hypothetical protein
MLMSNSVDLKELERKVYRDSLQDGIMEILLGFLLIVCGLLMINPKVFAGIMSIYVLFLLFLPRLLDRMKRRFTYPRLGEAALPQEEPKPLAAGILGFTLAAGVLVALTLALLGRLTTDEWYRWLPVWMGLCFVGASWYLYSKSGRARYVVCGLFALGAGFAIGSLQLPRKMDNISLYLIGLGVVAALIGVVKLLRFVRSTPVATQEAPNDGPVQ